MMTLAKVRLARLAVELPNAIVTLPIMTLLLANPELGMVKDAVTLAVLLA